MKKATIEIWITFAILVLHTEFGQVTAATVRFSALTGENRFLDLLELPDGITYLNSSHKSFLRASRVDDEYTLEFHFDEDDPGSPVLAGTIFADDSWIEIEIAPKQSMNGLAEILFFDPYFSINERDHYWFGRHVLKPDNYQVRINFFDDSCNMLGENCSNEASLEYKIRFRAIDTPILGDANLNGKVGFDDFLTLSANFGGDLVYLDPWHSGDFNQSATTDMADFLILSANYGMTREPAPVAIPEPSSSYMAGFAVLLVLMIRKRRC